MVAVYLKTRLNDKIHISWSQKGIRIAVTTIKGHFHLYIMKNWNENMRFGNQYTWYLISKLSRSIWGTGYWQMWLDDITRYWPKQPETEAAWCYSVLGQLHPLNLNKLLSFLFYAQVLPLIFINLPPWFHCSAPFPFKIVWTTQ